MRKKQSANILLQRDFAIDREVLLKSLHGVIITDPKGCIQGVNPHFCELVGYEEEELLTMHLQDLVPAEMHDRLFRPQPGIGWSARPMELQRKDGTLLNSVVLVYPAHDGVEPYFMCTIRNVTKEHELSLKQQKNEALLRLITENAFDFIWTLDMEMNITYASDAVERLLGYTREEITRINTSRLYKPEMFKELQDVVKQELEKGNPHPGITLQTTHLRKDGTEFPAEIRGRIIYDSADRPIAMQGYTRDISAEVEAEAELKRSEERYRTLFNSSPDPIVVHDGEQILDANPACFRALGITKREDIIGQYPYQMIPESERQEAIDRYDLMMQGEELETKEIKVVTRAHDLRNVLATPVTIDWGGRRVVMVSYHDITSRVQAEKQLADSLAEKELLLHEVHHRVKNNLNIITSLLNLQSRAITNEAEALRACKDTRDRILSMSMVHDQLYRSGDFTQINMNPYIHSLISNLKNVHASGRPIRIQVDCPNTALDVKSAIPTGLILNELICNAFVHAFSDQAAGNLTVSLHQDAEGNYDLAVADDGIGFPEDLDIQRVETLGLRLVALLTEQLRGEHLVERADGTTIRIHFPNPRTT